MTENNKHKKITHPDNQNERRIKNKKSMQKY